MARIHISSHPSSRMIISFPYDPLLVEKVKTIEGRRWHPIEKYWSFPNSDGIVERILKVFEGEEIHLDPASKTVTSKVKDTPSPLEPKGAVPDFVVRAQSNDLWNPLPIDGGERGRG